jgi:hypothetical protein
LIGLVVEVVRRRRKKGGEAGYDEGWWARAGPRLEMVSVTVIY